MCPGVHLCNKIINVKINLENLDFRYCFINSIFDYINGARDKFIQVDMILNYMFRLGLRGKCLYRSMINPREVGALRAPTSWGFLKLL